MRPFRTAKSSSRSRIALGPAREAGALLVRPHSPPWRLTSKPRALAVAWPLSKPGCAATSTTAFARAVAGLAWACRLAPALGAAETVQSAAGRRREAMAAAWATWPTVRRDPSGRGRPRRVGCG